MRLIDLDKALLEAEDECRMSDDWKVSHEMMNVFKYQPIIKAIPIEWIKRYIAEEGIYPNRELLSVEQADAIERMIGNWEKENEESSISD